MDEENKCIIIANLDKICLFDYQYNKFTRKPDYQNFILSQSNFFLNIRDLNGL